MTYSYDNKPMPYIQPSYQYRYGQCGGILQILSGGAVDSFMVFIQEIQVNNDIHSLGIFSGIRSSQNNIILTIIDCIDDKNDIMDKWFREHENKNIKFILYNQNGTIVSELLMCGSFISEFRPSNMAYVSNVFFDNIPVSLTRRVLIEKRGSTKCDFSMIELRIVFDSYQMRLE